MENGFCQGIKYQERRNIGCRSNLKLLISAPRSHQDAQTHPSIFSCLQIADGISDTNGMSEVHLVAFCGLQEQAWFRFPAGAGILWGMGADERVIHPATACLDYAQNMPVDLHYSLQSDASPAHSRLVGYKEDFYWRRAQFSQSFQSLWYEDHIVQASDVIGLVFDNHPIPVEE